MRTFIFALIMFLFPLHLMATSASTCSIASDPKPISSAISTLQNSDKSALANQTLYKYLIKSGGGGACATATAVNMIQIVREYLGLPRLDSKTIMHESFTALPALLDGRVTNEQMSDLMKYLERYSEGGISKIELDSAKNQSFQNNGVVWRDATAIHAKLSEPSSRKVQMLIYVVQDSSNKILGRHFVVLKEWKVPEASHSEAQIEVIDPNNPQKTYFYTIKKVTELGVPGYSLRLESSRLNLSANSTMTVDTLVTVVL